MDWSLQMFGSYWKLLENGKNDVLYSSGVYTINFQKFILFFSNLQKNFKLNKITTQFFFFLKRFDIDFFNMNGSDIFGN